FLLQEEDGIRDFHVTGVQTCALPIWMLASRSMMRSRTLSQPVIRPATAPAAVAAMVAENGSTPPAMRVAATAPPSGKLPSTVRSDRKSVVYGKNLVDRRGRCTETVQE